MNATILADASHCPHSLAGGYGYWIASGRGKRGGGGAFKGKIETNNTAEMMAVANALYEAVRNGLVMAGDYVLIQTDCMSAIHRLRGGLVCNTEQEQLAVDYFKLLCTTTELTVELRHVKGHSKKQERRFISNNICDRHAKKGMRQARKELGYAK